MISENDIFKLTPNANKNIVSGFVKWFNSYAPKFGVTTSARINHFLAQAAHETDNFRSLKEYASGAAYEGRKDLGNTQKGDGVKFKGRGIFQVTGRANYANYSKAMFGNANTLLNNPALLEQPQYAVLSAFLFWKDHNLNAIADKPNIWRGNYGKFTNLSPIEYITHVINGGTNGLNDRTNLLSKAFSIFIENPLNTIISWFFILIVVYVLFLKN